MVGDLAPAVELWCGCDCGTHPCKEDHEVSGLLSGEIFQAQVSPDYVKVAVEGDSCHGERRRDTEYQLR